LKDFFSSFFLTETDWSLPRSVPPSPFPFLKLLCLFLMRRPVPRMFWVMKWTLSRTLPLFFPPFFFFFFFDFSHVFLQSFFFFLLLPLPLLKACPCGRTRRGGGTQDSEFSPFCFPLKEAFSVQDPFRVKLTPPPPPGTTVFRPLHNEAGMPTRRLPSIFHS